MMTPEREAKWMEVWRWFATGPLESQIPNYRKLYEQLIALWKEEGPSKEFPLIEEKKSASGK